jgi:hypothetical protein
VRERGSAPGFKAMSLTHMVGATLAPLRENLVISVGETLVSPFLWVAISVGEIRLVLQNFESPYYFSKTMI